MENQQNTANESNTIKFNKSLVQRAKAGEQAAIKELFAQFLPQDEMIDSAYYLGVEGMWGIGTESYGCVTSRRVATLRIGAFGEVTYQDGYLENMNSAYVKQPSKLGLYVYAFILIVLAVPTLGISLLMFPVIARFYYRLHKCGAIFVIGEGISVYVFTNRKLLSRANELYRRAVALRDPRMMFVRKP